MAKFIISLDFELFWGVADSRTITDYCRNIEGVWEAIPKMLVLFEYYGVRATWATVGMLMCRDYLQWLEIRPTILPSYAHQKGSTYDLGVLAQKYPKLFFARPLVKQILSTPGQEIASHTYSHFFCGEAGVTPEQLAADLVCASQVASDLGVTYSSLVWPRNQVLQEFVAVLTNFGIDVYRGNQDHWLYRNGHFIPGGLAGRAMRLVDSYFPVTGDHYTQPIKLNGSINVPASHFLRPWSNRVIGSEPLRLVRLKNAMTAAACSEQIFHLWWHPHNFGVNIEHNIATLESLLRHYIKLKDRCGMISACMSDFVSTV